MPLTAPERILFDDGARALELRRARPADAPALVEAILDSLDALRAFMPWSHDAENNTVAAQTARLEGVAAAWDAGREFIWHLYRRDGGGWRLSGSIGLHPRCLNPRGLEIGYWVRSEAAGRGLCTLATRMIVLAGFEAMGLERVQVGCDRANAGSLRVIEKVGFTFEGLLRGALALPGPALRAGGALGTGDMRMYGFKRGDWEGLPWVDALRAGVSWPAR